MAKQSFTFTGFLWRWALALALVLGTYNPTDYSFVSWAMGEGGDQAAIKYLVGVVLLILYVVYLRATWASIGALGVILALALLGGLVWVGVDLGAIDIEDPGVLTWVLLVVVATVMAIGLSWSHVRRRLSGQLDVDDDEG